MADLYIKNAHIVNEGKIVTGNIIVEAGKIKKVFTHSVQDVHAQHIIDASGKYVLPGIIDDQVHFREPGLTHKADIYHESRAAAAGGITSFMEMPNTQPQTITQELLKKKFEIGARKSMVNYSFYMGTTNDNLEEVLKTDPKTVCGIKIFMGSSTGNMLVDNMEVLEKIFASSRLLIAVHCENENMIQNNIKLYKQKYGEDLSFKYHPLIRNEETCYSSSSLAVSLAKKHNTRLHILHLSTGKETTLFDNTPADKNKRITSEVCIHHLWFNDKNYDTFGSRIKWNPAIKSENDRQQLWEALLDDRIDVIATDHAPHTLEEKSNTYFNAPAGGPLVQHSLPAMLDFYHQNKISLEKIVEKMCHSPARIFNIKDRGFIREGYWADLAIVDLNKEWIVNKENIIYKCGWSPFEGHKFRSAVITTIVNGEIILENGNLKDPTKTGMALEFNR
jgi:dihydroorotase